MTLENLTRVTCVAPALLAALRAPPGGGGGGAVLAEGVLGGGGAARVLAAVSQHALVAAAAPAVVKQGRLAHGGRKLPAQHAAVGTRMKTELKKQQANCFF